MPIPEATQNPPDDTADFAGGVSCGRRPRGDVGAWGLEGERPHDGFIKFSLAAEVVRRGSDIHPCRLGDLPDRGSAEALLGERLPGGPQERLAGHAPPAGPSTVRPHEGAEAVCHSPRALCLACHEPTSSGVTKEDLAEPSPSLAPGCDQAFRGRHERVSALWHPHEPGGDAPVVGVLVPVSLGTALRAQGASGGKPSGSPGP